MLLRTKYRNDGSYRPLVGGTDNRQCIIRPVSSNSTLSSVPLTPSTPLPPAIMGNVSPAWNPSSVTPRRCRLFYEFLFPVTKPLNSDESVDAV